MRSAPRAAPIAAGTAMDAVTQLVGDLDLQLRYYRDVLGLQVVADLIAYSPLGYQFTEWFIAGTPGAEW